MFVGTCPKQNDAHVNLAPVTLSACQSAAEQHLDISTPISMMMVHNTLGVNVSTALLIVDITWRCHRNQLLRTAADTRKHCTGLHTTTWLYSIAVMYLQHIRQFDEGWPTV